MVNLRFLNWLLPMIINLGSALSRIFSSFGKPRMSSKCSNSFCIFLKKGIFSWADSGGMQNKIRWNFDVHMVSLCFSSKNMKCENHSVDLRLHCEFLALQIDFNLSWNKSWHDPLCKKTAIFWLSGEMCFEEIHNNLFVYFRACVENFCQQSIVFQIKIKRSFNQKHYCKKTASAWRARLESSIVVNYVWAVAKL